MLSEGGVHGRIPPEVGGAGHCLVRLASSRCRVLVGLSLTVLLKASSEALFILYQITTTHILHTCRFLNCSELWGDTRETIDNMFMDYLQKAPQDQHEEVGPYTLTTHVNDMPVQSKKQQFLLLGSISNYHILPHPDSTSATEN